METALLAKALARRLFSAFLAAFDPEVYTVAGL
jgi:hypothetical protein